MFHTHPREYLIFLVYVTLLLDNMLLTVIVPILPDFLSTRNDINHTIPPSVMYKNFDLHYMPQMLSKHPHAGKSIASRAANFTSTEVIKLEDENGSIGVLLAVKAFVQLGCNPFVGIATKRLGYSIPIFLGTLCIFVASVVFALGENYPVLFFARAIQGVGSSCIGVCGMSLVAQLYPEEDRRSKIMGIVLGSIAVGVLIGYPFGGILYDFYSKSMPFYVIGGFLFVTLALQLIFLNLTLIAAETPNQQENTNANVEWWSLLGDRQICLIAAAIWVSTSAMAILEPCLPIWLLSHLHPKKWQLGTVFIPDSIGYLIGTNFFGGVAFTVGQVKISLMALLLVGLSCVVIPNATTVLQLLMPHFGLGLGIGVLDAALVPMLAALVDAKFDDYSTSDSQYGLIYAIQQTAVSLAYSIAPILGGELAQSVGFPWLMRIIGILNLIYGPVFMYYSTRFSLLPTCANPNDILLAEVEPTRNRSYKKFYDSIE